MEISENESYITPFWHFGKFSPSLKVVSGVIWPIWGKKVKLAKLGIKKYQIFMLMKKTNHGEKCS